MALFPIKALFGWGRIRNCGYFLHLSPLSSAPFETLERIFSANKRSHRLDADFHTKTCVSGCSGCEIFILLVRAVLETKDTETYFIASTAMNACDIYSDRSCSKKHS